MNAESLRNQPSPAALRLPSGSRLGGAMRGLRWGLMLQPVAQRICARLEKLLRSFSADRLCEMTQRTPVQTWLVTELRHQIPAVPFHPADFVFVQFVFPACYRRGADFGKTHAGRVISPPPNADLGSIQVNF